MTTRKQDNQSPAPETKPRGAKKFFKALGLLAQFRFADAVEYINDGDTEN